jgi:hypothetical protein
MSRAMAASTAMPGRNPRGWNTLTDRVVDGPARPHHHASTIDRRWAKLEAGAIPARPRHCERSETRLGTSAQNATGGDPLGRRDRRPRARRPGPPRAHVGLRRGGWGEPANAPLCPVLPKLERSGVLCLPDPIEPPLRVTVTYSRAGGRRRCDGPCLCPF